MTARRVTRDELEARAAAQPRRTGSVRYAPYFKLQVWRTDVGGAWVDIQVHFDDADTARTAATAPGRYRLMEVRAGVGRRPSGEPWVVGL